MALATAPARTERAQGERKRGRPARITRDAIVEAACGLGTERVDMAQLAERLGIGVGTLYRYVRDRDHLVELVAARRSRRQGVVDRGQSWQEAVRESAESAFRVFSNTPDLIGHVMTGSIAEETDPETSERLLSLLVARGFTPVHALDLYRQVQQVIAGAVVAHAFKRSMDAKFGGYAGLVRRVGATLGIEKIPTLCSAIENGEELVALGDYGPTLGLIIAAAEQRYRRETIAYPDDA